MSLKAPSRAAILYVEDDENDILLLQYALKKARIPNSLKTVRNGEEAVDYLSGSGQYGNREQYPIPGLVLLDLNLPRLSGLKVLQWIREQPQFVNLPVVIYTSSEQPGDQENAKHWGANEYVVKLPFIDKIATTVQRLKERWLGH